MRLKVALHCHSSLSDGEMSPGQLLRFLRDHDYRVVAITDHNHMTIPHELQTRGLDDMIILNGVEWTLPQYHLVLIDLPLNKTRTFSKFDVTNANLKFIAHPFWTLNVDETLNYCDLYQLDGIEKFNRGIECFFGEDVIGYNYYACDDLHIRRDIDTSWIELETDSFDKQTIIEKLKEGDYWIVTKVMDYTHFI